MLPPQESRHKGRANLRLGSVNGIAAPVLGPPARRVALSSAAARGRNQPRRPCIQSPLLWNIKGRIYWCSMGRQTLQPLRPHLSNRAPLCFSLRDVEPKQAGRSITGPSRPFFSGTPAIGPAKVLVALLLLAGWVVVIQATRRSLGLGGTILIAGIFGALVWLLIAKGGVFQPHSATAFSHLGLVALSLLLAIGMSRAIVHRKLTGQVEVDTERR